MWFGELPRHWEAKRTAAIFQQRNERNDPIKTDFILSLSAKNGVVLHAERTEKGGNKPKDDLSKYSVARSGDLLVNCMNVLAGSSGVTKWDGAISPVYYALYLRFAGNVNIWYYHYVFRLVTFYRSLIGLGKGILFHESESGSLNTIRLRISMTSLNNVIMPIPPREEQDQIVRYLDWKVSQINKLINTKRRQIALLLEGKNTFIDESLTNIKDSWVMHRAKHLFKERDERSEHGEEVHLSMSQKYGLVSQDNLNERRMVSESYKGGKICYEDDIVLNRLKAHLGVFALAPQKGVISPDYTVLKINEEKILPKYAEYYLKSNACRYELVIRVRGVVEGFWRLYTDDFNTISIPVPPLNEQAQIISTFEAEDDRIGRLIKILNNEVGLLAEYRTRLISDVVTGKKDVRGVIIPDYEVVEAAIDNDEQNETEVLSDEE